MIKSFYRMSKFVLWSYILDVSRYCPTFTHVTNVCLRMCIFNVSEYNYGAPFFRLSRYLQENLNICFCGVRGSDWGTWLIILVAILRELCFLVWTRFWCFCWLDLGNKQQREIVERHQTQVRERWRRWIRETYWCSLNRISYICRNRLISIWTSPSL